MSDTYNIGPTVPGLFAAHESRFKEAADEIDRLRATLERLREALESIAGGEIYPVQVALDALMAEVEGTK